MLAPSPHGRGIICTSQVVVDERKSRGPVLDAPIQDVLSLYMQMHPAKEKSEGKYATIVSLKLRSTIGTITKAFLSASLFAGQWGSKGGHCGAAEPRAVVSLNVYVTGKATP
jgi:hypothetical protein